jgi:integrase
MKCIVNEDVVLSRPLEGPVSAHVAPFAQWARDQGYARASRYRQVLLAACFSRWLGRQTIPARRVGAAHAVRYLRSRARRVQIHRGDRAALQQFVHFLQHEGVIRFEPVAARRASPVERETQTFETYLRHERVLAEPTITYYVTFTREFLTDRFGRGPVTLARLCAREVVRFVQRASEVALLELDDLDWEGRQVTVRGKRGARAALPLPADVGGAIAAYLRHARPHSSCRRVFLRARAPRCGFAGPSAIACIVRAAIERGGVDAPTKGAHQFRHGLATQMLRGGASLSEIGEILRHRSPDTTTIYAKVDLDALRTLALPWPGGAR